MKDTLKAVRAAKRALAKFAKDLPDLDAHSSTFCIANDAVEYLDTVLMELPVRMKEAKDLAKKNPNWPGKKRF